MKEILYKLIFKTEGHRCVSFWSIIIYIFICALCEKNVSNDSLLAMITLYGATQVKDGWTDKLKQGPK